MLVVVAIKMSILFTSVITILSIYDIIAMIKIQPPTLVTQEYTHGMANWQMKRKSNNLFKH